jgi:hypothetical protein
MISYMCIIQLQKLGSIAVIIVTGWREVIYQILSIGAVMEAVLIFCQFFRICFIQKKI